MIRGMQVVPKLLVLVAMTCEMSDEGELITDTGKPLTAQYLSELSGLCIRSTEAGLRTLRRLGVINRTGKAQAVRYWVCAEGRKENVNG